MCPFSQMELLEETQKQAAVCPGFTQIKQQQKRSKESFILVGFDSDVLKVRIKASQFQVKYEVHACENEKLKSLLEELCVF